MRVLYFSRAYTPHDHRFLSALARSPHEVFFLQLEDGRGIEERRPLPAGVSRIDWWGGRRRLRQADMPRAVFELMRVLKEVRPALVHAGPVQRVAFLAALGGFRPLLTMSWGSDLLLEARRGWGRQLARFTLRRSALFACDCEVVRKAALDLGMRQDRTVVFPWGVDLTQFSPGEDDGLRARLGWRDAFIVISTRSWEPIYGPLIALEGFRLAAARVPNLRLLLVGDGSLRGEVEERIGRSGLEDRVFLPGMVEPAALPGFYRSADLYLSASRSDGSSVSLLEAMACGRPALVSDIPGNREWIEAGWNGWHFADGDPANLATKLEAAASSGSHRRFGERARETVVKRADWRSASRVMLAAYDRAVAMEKRR